ncbi:MAG: phosphate ABC transporter permease PstA [Treponema sp.]
MNNHLKIEKIKNSVMTVVFYSIGGLLLLFLLALVTYIIIKGFKGFDFSLFSFSDAGIGNQFFNTIYLVILSLIISIPLGTATGIYMAEYATQGRFTGFLEMSIETLSSLPSIVVGLFGYLVFILMTHSRWNLMAGALALFILNLPLIASTTVDAFKSLPENLKEGSFALGATHWQTIYHVLLPAAATRIMTGVMLAAGRGFGEAAALLYTAGMSTDIDWTNWNMLSATCPINPFRPGETLALHIWGARTEALAPNAAQIADLSSAVLVIMIFSFSIISEIINARIRRKTGVK